ncbi:phage protein GemA/Gp16 family protein [Pseudoalteromonas luteoviolacea]|uniref:Uncharacterized protein n=1 Tax=Pseudoalteromonas luteoviolacea S4054 TaxID=1129367 RepID=A0A0F6ADA4_9GAMM|nr:phage protein GemA/Gp16 family protein [Pseudoalteromonas luteoviolacea]AOT08234.1 hypothetical protein S4054249_10455 [Pseudoalteromonas luteoviolacea]AOT13150.1 hypothetical protein S40542_10430 [Pseudoalteromonas luteoviolacea]AOT18062.1 hypothetical protein S4054_10425 [Pseudoalteromonas luteoviolacea]KKE84165.1 hypothetical protein N479_09710 [Pseudoalteromonas luteoviolacea S4054]KZN76230.1 hypothetical protein N481_07705 [Pseudoalteromonas luteoviolacea S4047-1]
MNPMIKAIKAAQRAAGIDQVCHVKNVKQISGGLTNSCTGLTKNQQKALLRRYRVLAEMPKQLRLIYSLWGQLARAGKVKQDSKQACETFCEKYCNGQRLHEAESHWSAIIEILKQWLHRGGPNHA